MSVPLCLGFGYFFHGTKNVGILGGMKYLLLGFMVAFFALAPLLVPVEAWAAPCSGVWRPGCDIVPECDFSGGQGPYCQACDLIKLVNNLIAFGIYLSVMVATVMFAYAGFLYVTASASPENVKKAKDLFTKVFMGFVFILIAWLIVDLTLSVFTGKGFGFWSEFTCEEFREVQSKPLPLKKLEEIARSKEGGGCLDCVTMDPSIPQKGGLGGLVDDDLNKKLKEADLQSLGLQVTENYPPTVDHENICHYEGTCVDVNKANRIAATGEEVKKTTEELNSVGLRGEYEVKTEARRDELIKQGASPDSVRVVPTINAEHYSVYCDTCGG